MIIEKSKIHDNCVQLIEDRIERLNGLIESAQKASNEDTKSSAGDKYETGRAMMQAEKDKALQQLEEAYKLKKVLSQINTSTIPVCVELGALVETSIGDLYISVGLGEIKIDEYTCFSVSLVSPIGKAIMALKEGEKVEFNKQTIEILGLN